MVEVTYPGVYVQELPSGTHTISGVATSVTGIMGYLRRGPIDTAVQLFNFGDFQRVFGGLDDASDLSFQVSQFFLNGGTECWVSRCVSSAQPPALASASLPCGALGEPHPTPLTVTAANPGTWGQDVYLTVDYMTPPGSKTFNLTATRYAFTGGQASAVQSETLSQALAGADPNTALIAVDIPAGAAPPLPSGTVLSFIAPATAQSGLSLSISVTLEGEAPSAPAVVPIGPVQTQASFVTAVQSALATAAHDLGVPALAQAVVRAFTSPFDPSAGPLVQIWMADPLQAATLVEITCSQPSLAPQRQANPQAMRLAIPAGAAHPDGAPPTGFDIAGNSSARKGIYAFDAVPMLNLICAPDLRGMDTSNSLAAATATLNYAIQRKAFAILDLPSSVASVSEAVQWATATPGTFGTGVISAASYFPEVQVPTPFSAQPRQIGPSGTMAGVYAQTDVNRGVWKAPAGITTPLAGVQQLAYVMNDAENGEINPLGINALRTFPTYDNIAWGARTLASPNVADDDWKYVPVRRLALYIEQSLIQGLQWVVFEPNGPTLWASVQQVVNAFLHPLYLQGAFVGSTSSQAYQVICDASTTTPEDIDNGIVNVLVLFAPVKPAEFVVLSLQLMAGQPAL